MEDIALTNTLLENKINIYDENSNLINTNLNANQKNFSNNSNNNLNSLNNNNSITTSNFTEQITLRKNKKPNIKNNN